jgi:hypothetical protein
MSCAAQSPTLYCCLLWGVTTPRADTSIIKHISAYEALVELVQLASVPALLVRDTLLAKQGCPCMACTSCWTISSTPCNTPGRWLSSAGSSLLSCLVSTPLMSLAQLDLSLKQPPMVVVLLFWSLARRPGGFRMYSYILVGSTVVCLLDGLLRAFQRDPCLHVSCQQHQALHGRSATV